MISLRPRRALTVAVRCDAAFREPEQNRAALQFSVAVFAAVH
jgi:hypothetical protein